MTAFATQIDQNGSGRDRCAAGVLASCMLSEGWQSDPFGLTVQVADEARWTDQGANSQQLMGEAARYGFQSRKWTAWQEALDALAAGQYVACLNMNAALRPTAYPLTGGWRQEHWLRLLQVLDGGEMAYCYDPLCYLPQIDGSIYEGPTVYTVESLRAAIAATPQPEAGVVLWRP